MRNYVLALPLAIAACSGNSPALNEGWTRASVTPASLSGGQTGAPVGDIVLREAATEDIKPASGTTPADHFMITLTSAFICDFRESGGGFDFAAGSNRDSTKCEGGAGDPDLTAGVATRGEIAITAAMDVRGTGDEAAKSDRVVFFSNDVRESGQMLNFVNIPIYGPTPYINASAKLTIKIFELDTEEARENAELIGKLAELGQSFASPAQAIALNVLTSLGQAFTIANTDDLEMKFELGIDPRNAASAVLRNEMHEGYIAMIRKENRSDPTHFDGLRICPAQGFITKDKTCDDAEPWRGSTWLLLRISKERSDVTQAMLLDTLMSTLQASDYLNRDASGADRAKVYDHLTKAVQAAQP